MNNPDTLQSLGESAKILRTELIDRISTASDADKALKVALERAKQSLPEYAAYEMTKTRVAIARNDYDAAVSAFRKEQAIA